MIKIAGALIVIICSSIAGHMKASTYKKRTIELENIIEIIKLMEMEITYKKEPLMNTFEKIAALKKCWFSDTLKDCSKNLCTNMSLDISWKKALDKHSSKSPLEAHDISILDDLITSLGKSDSEGQVKLIEPTVVRLKSAVTNSYKKEERLGKMYRALGTSIGVVLVILLI